ncbi:NAD(P)-dependent dehydrogenase (short-subunit alcohol dehydrogenase family) [Bradyrhizobium sp. cir1]|uniref:SDR family NAD(P)-dependent oxidoreductase n=1 Tax=Bradyrhizobium sp. cir1 TaxID=1445730 RepID=UPI0016067E61|nr:SDR family NAD(P)-dependent oxidoreductase [Bradyrhizobium sp. cir1]MBB4375140.1 NAD(P)-dependent dehydrogenase (short-subunit alcohol dehydrogenase family) [Bradyrhizobium sp. cir1]
MTAVLITGASRGIGFAIARQYAADGADVIGCCREPAVANALKDLAVVSGGRAQIMQLDVSDETSIAWLKRALNEQPIDILINNAGILGPEIQSDDDIDAEGWITTLRVNALAPILIAQALRDNLRRSSEKKLVAISSEAGSTSMDCYRGSALSRNRYAYRASKAALNNGMHRLARDWASDGVLVGILNPGFVRTHGRRTRRRLFRLNLPGRQRARHHPKDRRANVRYQWRFPRLPR